MKEAIDYINEGLNPIPIPLKQKAPNIPNWQNLKVNNSNVEQYFNGQPSNIGVVLGKNIVDVDIDSNFVKPFCDILLPNTGKIFGRQSNPRSHYLFKSSGTSKKFEIRNNTLIEIRTGDQQTVFPPSIHTSGEKIRWEKNTSYGETDFTDLHQKVGLIAFLGFVLSQYPSSAGTRDDLCLCISSILIKKQIDQDTASEIVQKLAQLGGDEEWSSRDKIKSVIKRLDLNKPLYGLKKLSEILGLNDQEKDKLHSWLTINQDDQKTHPLVITSHLEGLQTIIPKPDWLVDRLIMKKTVFMISGFGGSGKSTLVLNLAVYGAYSKKEFLKRNIPTPFSTLIINQEDTKNIMYLKIKGIINPNLLYALGGLTKTMGESMLVFAPHANSWRRLVLGSYAPVTPNWGLDNRSVAFRIPSSNSVNRRIEHRVSGVDANPYLVALTVISAMRYGMKNKVKAPPQTKGNAYEQKFNSKIKMPHDWSSAILSAKKSKFLKETLGPDLHKAFIAIKEMEYQKVASTVSELDIDLYLNAI